MSNSAFRRQLLRGLALLDELNLWSPVLDSEESKWLREGTRATAEMLGKLLAFLDDTNAPVSEPPAALDAAVAPSLAEETARRVSAFTKDAVAIIGDDFEILRLSLPSDEQRVFVKLVGYYLSTIYFQFNEPIWAQYPYLGPDVTGPSLDR